LGSFAIKELFKEFSRRGNPRKIISQYEIYTIYWQYIFHENIKLIILYLSRFLRIFK